MGTLRAARYLFQFSHLNFSFPVTDLKTMGERLKNRYYTHRKLFMADMARMLANCRHYNEPDTEYCKCANSLERFYIAKMKEAGIWDK